MNPAANVRREKEQHPERFCPVCLWRVKHVRGGDDTPCPKHTTVDARLAEWRKVRAQVVDAQRRAGIDVSGWLKPAKAVQS